MELHQPPEGDRPSGMQVSDGGSLKHSRGDFPGGPEVKTSPSNVGDVGSTPGWAAKTPHASQPKKIQNLKQKQNCNKFNKDFKKGPHQRKKERKKERNTTRTEVRNLSRRSTEALRSQ